MNPQAFGRAWVLLCVLGEVEWRWSLAINGADSASLGPFHVNSVERSKLTQVE